MIAFIDIGYADFTFERFTCLRGTKFLILAATRDGVYRNSIPVEEVFAFLQQAAGNSILTLE
jgi:hypothetical protein